MLLAPDLRALWTPPYGLKSYGDLFTPRQLVALTTFSDLVPEVQKRVERDAMAGSMNKAGTHLANGGGGVTAYSEAVATYMALALDKSAVYWNSLCPWLNQPKNEIVGNSFGRQALPMVWDYAEANPLSDSGGNIDKQLEYVVKALQLYATTSSNGVAQQADASTQEITEGKLVSTDPPYYDNIGYADLSDFFYVWLRRALRPIFPDLFATVAVPKTEELVATPYRHASKEEAERFFLDGMTQAMHRLAKQAHPAFPITIYYAFKQAETEGDTGTASTGWETFLDAVIRAGFAVGGTWPMRTERQGRMTGNETNALASSIVLVCRQRLAEAPTATRRDFVTALKNELPVALAHLQRSNIAPVDLAQAAIGPGMAIFTRYARVLDATGHTLRVRDALGLINQTLDEVLAEQEGDFDADTRWALAWFEQSGFSDGDFGVADVLARAKATAVDALVRAGIAKAGRGKVRLLRPAELPDNWHPEDDERLTVWEIVHHLVRRLESDGESAAAELLSELGSKAEIGRELAYRLYTLCERKKRAVEALSYNALVQSWPEIAHLAQQSASVTTGQTQLFGIE